MEDIIRFQESDLELVVSEKTLGSLTTNAKQIRDIVQKALPLYDISNYNDDNIEQAKKDKAMLNKAAKALNAKRLDIEREFMKPFGEFKEVVNETVSLIKQCSDRIDGVVKANEQQYRDQKLAAIKDYFEANNANLVDFNKVFNPSWLNKSVSDKTVFGEIDSLFRKVDTEIETLKSFSEDFDVLRTYYMETMNLTATVQYANKLKETRERAKAAEEELKKAAAEKMEAETTQAEEKEIVEVNANQPNIFGGVINPTRHSQFAASVGQPTLFVQPTSQNTQEDSPELLTRVFTVTTTKEKIIALSDFLNDNDIDFDKVDMDAADLCKTDLNTIIGMLEYGISLIEKTATKPREQDKGRQFGQMIKKIQKKLEN